MVRKSWELNGFPSSNRPCRNGVLLGPDGFTITRPISASFANSLGYVALILILFEGGLHGSYARMRKAWVPALSLATVGIVIGIGVGFLGSLTNQRIKLDTGGLYPTLSLAFALLSYAVADIAHGCGFLSVYIASVVIGNRKPEHRYSIMRFHEGLSWTMHIVMFVVHGYQLALGRLVTIVLRGAVPIVLVLTAVLSPKVYTPSAILYKNTKWD